MVNKAVPIGDVLRAVVKRLGLERRLKEARIAEDWGRIVGEKIAVHSRPVAVKGRTLIVNVDSSVWLSEMNNFFKDKILDRLRSEFRERRIEDIRFRIGEI